MLPKVHPLLSSKGNPTPPLPIEEFLRRLFFHSFFFLLAQTGNRVRGQRDYLGEFEQLVLLAIVRLGAEAYGMKIRREIEERAKRPTSIGALYLTLERLEQKQFIKSEVGEATAERGGRAKRFFTVNASGKAMLRKSLRAVQRMAIDSFAFGDTI